jgi:TonB-linked SusC/RagA family outer membrane protein
MLMKRNLLLSLLLMLAAGVTYAQTKVTGKVTTAGDDSALPGVTVQVKGTSVGTQTDGEGNYSVTASKNQTLIFSFIGMQTQEIAVGNRSIVNVSLAESENLLNEVIVLTALGLERKKDDDMSSSTIIDTDALQRSGESGVIQGLSGKTSGLTITRNSGDPGAGAYIQIRGQNTISGSSSPLIILDGVPISNSSIGSGDTGGVVQQSRLNDINPDDIANITILKGAAAAAVWGTGAANGVILIQTKRGNAGGKKVSVNITNQTSWDVINREYEKQGTFGQGYPRYWATGNGDQAYDYLYVPNTGFSWGDKIAARPGGADEVRQGNQRFEADGGNVYYPILSKNSREVFNDKNRDQVFQTGFTWNKSVGINFNNAGSTTYLSFSDWDQEGIIKGNSDYRRSTVRVNNETQLAEKLKVRINSTFIRTNSSRIQTGSNLNGLYLGYLRTSPDFDNTDYRGTYYNAAGAPTLNSHRGYRRYLGDAAPIYNNPGWTTNEQENTSDVYRFIINPEINWNIYKGLNLTARYGFDFYNDARETFFPVNSAGSFSVGSFNRNEITERNESVNVFLNSTHIINSDINFSWILGAQAESLNYTSFGATSADFTNPFVGDLRIFGNASAANENPGLTRQQQRKSATYAVVNAELFGQVYLEATGRYELPSTLSSPVFYPSASAGWVFTNNMSSNTLSFGKIRASYGEVGIEPIPYANRTTFGAFDRSSSWGDFLGAATYGNPFARSSRSGNPNLEPERVKEYEIGGDFRFFNNLVNFGITHYSRTTTGALLAIDLAPSTGFGDVWRNAGEISNKGIEIDAGVRLVKSRGIEWRIDANFSQNRNIVESLSGAQSVFLNGFTGTSSRVVEGEPFGTLWGGKWARDEGGNYVLDENGFPTVDPQEGILGDPNPQWRGGIGTNFSYKGFTLSAQFETFQGNKTWAGTSGVLNYFGISPETANEFTTTEELRTADGRTVASGTLVRGNIADFGGGNVLLDSEWYTGNGGGFGPVGEQFVIDGSWTKLRELSLTYDLPTTLISKAKLSNASIGVTGRNLFILSPFPNVDPELNLTGASKGRGLDYFTNPGTGSYMLTVKLGF